MNVMQAGLKFATKVIAVSQGYAWEITTDMGGWGLAQMLKEMGDGGKLTGIVNGRGGVCASVPRGLHTPTHAHTHTHTHTQLPHTQARTTDTPHHMTCWSV